MKFFKSNKTLILGCILLIYLVSRLISLQAMPVFLDEAIHIELAKKAFHDEPFTGLHFGRWLAVEIFAVFLGIFTHTLLSARLLIVGLGFLTVIALYSEGCASTCSNAKTRGIGMALTYLITPYALCYDRIALVDQFLTLSLAIIVFFSYRIVRRKTLLDQLGLSATLICSPVLKFAGLLFLPVPIIIALFSSKQKGFFKKLHNLILPYAISFPLILLFAGVSWHCGFQEKLINPQNFHSLFAIFADNVQETLLLFWIMLTPGLVIALFAGCLGILWIYKDLCNKERTLTALVILIAIWLPQIVMFRIWYPRYYLPLLVPICMLGGEIACFLKTLTAQAFKNRKAYITVITIAAAICLANPIIQSFKLLVDPVGFHHYKLIRSQFFTGWASGYGLKEAVYELNRIALEQPQGIILLRSSRWDLPLMGIDVYHRELGPKVDKITLHSWGSPWMISDIVEMMERERPTYLIFNSALTEDKNKKAVMQIRSHFTVEEVAHYTKPGGNPGFCIQRLTHKESETGK